MIDYRFLYPAEEEMIEASLFYEAASDGLGNNFLPDVQFGTSAKSADAVIQKVN